MEPELGELKVYVFGTGDGRRFITTARSDLGATSQILEKFPTNRSHDGPLETIFKIVEAPLETVIEERLTTFIKVL